MNYPKIWRALT